ncbi:group II intron maturase-specific domain-containing protein [Crocinitomix catalasitica]|uniref:group II intron maturase-specific domain-containing protein n=1 Tax=Crocinitomix catalasitica TaxID=184607 RepID=UPI00047FBB30|nr:group II intron maturase-specific domain-containing protein [Crocinitomix catalasitica]
MVVKIFIEPRLESVFSPNYYGYQPNKNAYRSRKQIADKLEELNIRKLTFKRIVGVAQYLNSMIRGWVNYFGKFKMYELTKVFRLLSVRLVWWAKQRYKRYKTSIKKAYK